MFSHSLPVLSWRRQPLELAKIRIQETRGPAPSSWQVISGIVRQDGVRVWFFFLKKIAAGCLPCAVTVIWLGLAGVCVFHFRLSIDCVFTFASLAINRVGLLHRPLPFLTGRQVTALFRGLSTPLVASAATNAVLFSSFEYTADLRLGRSKR